jgi:hypothetical protein
MGNKNIVRIVKTTNNTSKQIDDNNTLFSNRD